MDYDENDFQSQKFQLVGEDNKFSANLPTFSLPKFDLDEHLRFDSLVETEVLLGIQGEGNNWIDFPSGSTAVEFSSSAAESCSISRHNNVWSEATSSESVDLLLKSVGEDEIMNSKAVIMESSVNDGSHGIDNQLDLYVKKDDAHNSSMMNVLPSDQDIIVQDECPENLSSPSEFQREPLPHLQGSSQASEVEESRSVFNLDPSDGKFSSDGKIAGDQYMAEENVTSLDDAIEKPRVADKVLCETVLNEGDACDVLMRTSASNFDDCDSCVVACHNPLSITCRINQDERLVMETTKFSTGLFLDEQNQGSISSISDLPFDNAQKEKSMLIHSDETNNQLVPKSGALELMKKSSDSVISEDIDGLVSISRQTNYLIRDGETGNNFFEKQDDANQLAKEQCTKFENKSGNISSKAILKMSSLTKGHRSGSGRLLDDSVEDDDVYSIRNQNSTLPCDDRGGTLVTCLDVFSNKQYPECQMTENNKTAEDMDVDRQEMKLDADKDIGTDESSLLAVVSDAETKSTPTYCKSGKPDTDSAEGHMAQVNILVDKEPSVPCANPGRVSLGMVSNAVEKVQDYSPAVWQTVEELSLDGSSGNKLTRENFDSVPLSLDLEKSMHLHLLPSEDTTDVDVVVEKKEPLIETLSASDVVHSADKDVKLLSGPASSLPIFALVSKKASDPASVSYQFVMEDTSPGKLIQDDSGAKLASPVKSTNSQLSQCITSFNMDTQQKEELSSSLAIPDLLVSKENELKLSGDSKLTNSRNYVDKETMNVLDSGSDCVEDALVNISTKNEASSVVQHPSLVKSIDCTPFQNVVPSSAVDAIGNEKSVLLEGTGSHGYGEGIDDSVKSLEGFSHVRNETSVLSVLAQTSCSDGREAVYFPSSIHDKCSCSPSNEQSDQCNFAARDFSDGQNVSAQTEDYVLIKPTNDSSQICIVSTAESNLSEKQSEDPSSSEHNCGSPIVISCRQCSRDSLEHQEDKVLPSESNLCASGNMDLVSSAKNEIAQKLECNSNDLKPHITSGEVKSFTFEVSTSGNFPERGDGSEWKSFPSLQLSDIPPKENSEGCPEEVRATDTSEKTPNKRKTKNATSPSNEKKTGSRGKTKKEAPALKQSPEMDAKYSSGTHKYVETSSKDLSLVGMRENSSVECCTIKTSSSLVVQTSSIPDLNSSSSSTLFQQPFTDLQQVQLRAQIFVYGALISGVPPDEAYMVSVFGDADGGRRLWEGIWHSLIAKFQNQKSPVSGYETPLHPQSVGTNVQSKAPGSSAAKSSSKIISSAVLNSTVPFPSPLWSHSYVNGHNTSMPRGTYLNFSQTPSPSTPWLPSQSRHHVDASNTWFSQSSHPGPWFVSSHSSALDGIKQYSTASFTETRHVTSARDLCGPHIPTIQVAPPSVLMSAADPTSTTTVAVLQMETTKKTGTSGSNKHTSKSQKSRKMNKGLAAEVPSLPVSLTSVESISALSGVESLPLPSASTLLSSNSPVKVASGAPVSISMSHIISPTHYQIICDSSNQQKANFSEETCSNIELAKLQAEDAATLAAASVKHSQAIWSQLAAQKKSGLVSQIEEKLASAAVAASVAASVAKAAAAAAKVAYDVALQAKIMADEAISAAKTGNTFRSPESGILDVGKKLAGITPISILKGMDKIHESVEVISAAREAAKRRIESASAATKQAENLDAIVKAAELAAEAVAQAGTIIAMGDPLPCTLGELVDAGPEEFRKAHHGASMKVSKWSNVHGEEYVGLSNVKASAKQIDEQFSKDEQAQKIASEGGLSSLIKCHEQLDGTAQGNFPLSGHESDNSVSYSGLQKGSLVEVMSDEDGRRGAWFSARVLDMKDNKAYVSYNDVSTNEGHLKEWIVLENGEKAPRIRTANSATEMKYEGTRKRRREHLGSCIWELGDHVDAWIHDRWREGTVAEKSSGDETNLNVYFPGKGDKQVVHAWNVRPSIIWKDGQWMEWSYLRGKSLKPHEGDTPQEKRQRLGRLEAIAHSEVDAAGMSKLSKNMLIEVPRKPEESRSLVLSAKDRAFSIGKNSREEGTSNALKTKQTGLQKEGSRVVFGVPRPGKKRKFMEVSKHYVAGNCEKVSESSDPIKFAKYLMPRASQKFKNTSKVDNKGKKPGESKPKVGVKAENLQSFQTRSQTEKGKALLTASNGETRPENHENVVSSFSGNSNSSDKMNTFKFGSFSRQAEKSNVPAVESESSVQFAPNAPLSKKKNVPGSESDLAGKVKPNLNRTSKGDGKGLGNPGSAIREAMEPRRSNRRIQPTSRLLEGIQSSLIISKIPSISHEKKSSRGNVHG